MPLDDFITARERKEEWQARRLAVGVILFLIGAWVGIYEIASWIIERWGK